MAGMSPKALAVLRNAGLTAVLGGAGTSIAFMSRAMRYQPSRILLLLFTIWVLSPFAGAVVAHILSKRWTALARPALYLGMLAVTAGSLPIYASVAFRYSSMKVGFAFLVVPLASWLALAAIAAILFLTGSQKPPLRR